MLDRPQLPDLSRVPIAAPEVAVVRAVAAALTGKLPSAKPAELIPKEFPFAGIWIPSEDPLLIGEQNFSVLDNLRYHPKSLIGVNGYSKISTTPEVTYPKLKSGIHFVKPIGGGTQSYVLVQGKTADLSASAVLLHPASIPNQGVWHPTPIWSDAVNFTLGRFSLAPDGNVAYCNEQESLIWGSSEHRCAAFLVVNVPGTFRRDYSTQVQDINTAPDSIATIYVNGSDAPIILIGSTRTLAGVKLYNFVPNFNSIVLEKVQFWSAAGWFDALVLADGTVAGGVALAQTGSVSWYTGGFDTIKIEDEYALYFYRLIYTGSTSAGTSISYATVNAPLQTIKDVWDGVYRTVIKFVSKRGGFQDLTLEVAESDLTEGVIGNVITSDYVLAGVSAQAQALFVKVKTHNSVGATLSVDFWDGSGWAGVQNLIDGTNEGGKSLGQTGTIIWSPPAANIEFPQTLFGQVGYYYRLRWSAELSTTTGVDLVQSIPASRIMHGFRFPFYYQGRLMLVGDIVGNQRNKAEFCAPNAPEVWNGDDTSDGGKALFFGRNTGEGLLAAVEIYNRFAGSLAYIAAFCAADETYVLLGNDPGSFSIFPVSRNLGCPAPLTMTSMEVAYSVAEDAQRNVALWLTASGPVMFDGSVLAPIQGLEPYFDPNDARCISDVGIGSARAWPDIANKEWNLTFPMGVGNSSNNVWVVYDLVRKRWFRKVPPTYLSGVVPVTDLSGRAYTYGMIETGSLLRLEHTHAWDGVPMVHGVETSDLIITRDALDLANLKVSKDFWEITRLRHLKVLALPKTGLAVTTASDLVVTHTLDGSLSGATVLTMPLTGAINRYVTVTEPQNRSGRSHRLRFEVTSGDAVIKLMGWSGIFELVRQDL